MMEETIRFQGHNPPAMGPGGLSRRERVPDFTGGSGGHPSNAIGAGHTGASGNMPAETCWQGDLASPEGMAGFQI